MSNLDSKMFLYINKMRGVPVPIICTKLHQPHKDL